MEYNFSLFTQPKHYQFTSESVKLMSNVGPRNMYSESVTDLRYMCSIRKFVVGLLTVLATRLNTEVKHFG